MTSLCSIIRDAEIHDEPVMITLGYSIPVPVSGNPAVDASDVCDSFPQEPIDPLSEKEEELRQRETLLDERESQLLEERDRLSEDRSRLENHLGEQLSQLTELIGNARFEATALVRDAEHQSVKLALAIARRLLRGELKHHPKLIARVVEEALESAGRQVVVRIRLAPDDVPLLQSVWDTSPATLVSRDVKIVADPKVHPGGCIIDTQTGIVDGSVESQWESIEAAFHNLERENRANEA